MDLFMPAERVLYDRAYYLSDEAERDYAFEVAEEHGIDVGEVLYSDELMKEVRDALDRDIDLYLDDEIANFDSMLRELKRGENPEHPAEISVVAMGSVGRWDGPSRGLVAANSLRDLIDGKGSADALVDCRIDRLVDTNGTFSIEASHHDGTAYLDVRLISGVSFDGKGFRLGGELYAPGKMDLDDFHILLGNLYDAPGVGPCSLPHFAERAYGAAQQSYRFGETVFDIYCETGGTDRPYKVMVSAGETVGKDAGTRFASVEEAKAWCYRYSMRELADKEKKPVPGEAASAAKKAAGCSGGDGADDAASMLADVAGNRFNREDIMRAILNGEDIHLDYWPDYEELEWATRVCGELLADTSLEWADGFIDAEKIETHEGLTVSDLSHAVECVLTDKFNDGLYEASLVDRTEIADTLAQEIKSRLDGGKLGHGPYVDSESLRDDLTERFGFFYDIDFSGLTFKTSLILSVKSLYFEGDVVDSALDWQADYLPCVCHRGGQGENDRWEYEPTDDYRPFTRPADIPESIFDKLCASQGTTIEKVVNDPVTKFERSFREDIFNSQQNSLVGLTVLATLPLDAFLDASLSMICRGDREKAGTFTVKPGTYEPIMGIYDPINGCGGTAGIELDTDFDIDPRDIKYTMMEPRGGKWESDRIDLYTPQDCFGFSEPFAGRIEYSEKKPKIAAKAKPDPADLGRRASVAAGATIRDGVDGGGIKL